MNLQSIVSFYRQLIRETRTWLMASFFIFTAGIIGGIAYYYIDPFLLERIRDMLLERFGDNLGSGWSLTWAIFKNNTQASLIASFGGILLGFIPAISMLFNGGILGYVVTAAGFGLSNPLALVVGLVPHGIIEIPTFLFAAALGLRLGLGWIRPPEGMRRVDVFSRSLKNIVYALPLIIAGLALAAIIEVFVSGALLATFNANL